MDYTFKEAVKIIKDANEKCKNGQYAIAVYSAYVAKEVFEKYNNPLGIEFCKDIITLGITHIRSKAIDVLIANDEEVTPIKIGKTIRTLQEVLDLGELLRVEVDANRLSLDDMAEVYLRLVDGDSFDPFKKSLFSSN